VTFPADTNPKSGLLLQAWQGLGRLRVLNPKLFIPLSVLTLVADFFFEGSANPEILSKLLWVSPLSMVVFVGTLLSFSLLGEKIIGASKRATILLLWLAMAVSVKSFLFLYLLYPESYLPIFAERIVGDLSIAGIFIVAAAVVINAHDSHYTVVLELNKVLAKLSQQRAITVEIASEVEAELQAKASKALMGELDKISQSSMAVLEAVESASLKLQIQQLIRQHVRPLSHELLARVEILRTSDDSQIHPSNFRHLFQMQFVPRKDTSFIASYFIAIPNILVTLASRLEFSTLVLFFCVSTSYPLIGRALQIGMPNRGISWWKALGLTALVSVIAYLPSGVCLYWLSVTYADVSPIVFTAMGVLVLTALASSSWFALQRTRDEKAQEVQKIQDEIRHELDLLDQTIWVARRKWAYIIHGTVQGSLTVAASRLEIANKTDDSLKKAVHSDIERAKAALANPANFDRPVRDLLEEIAQTWEGVCSFEYELSPSAEAAITRNRTSTTCFVEITKELIGNANRHGGANKFWMNAYLDLNGDLSIVAGNNGKLIPGSQERGLGYEMISQLTRNWKLGGTSSTTFTATLPLVRQ
jgi:hypothetical protein